MSVVIWRWASEFAGLLYSDEQSLVGALEMGSGDMHGEWGGGGKGDGSWGGLMDGDRDEYDLFDFRLGQWRHQ